MILDIKNIDVTTDGKTILKNFSLSIPQGGVHVIMGPNGSGKSTLCNVIMGHPDYKVSSGTITFQDKDLLSLSTDERSRQGIFLGFQYPREIPGISLANVLRTAINAQIQKHQKINPQELLEKIKYQLAFLNLSEEFITRPLNEHASGGEKKRLEIVQLGVLAPKLAILDEIDSGLDIDVLKSIALAIKKFSQETGITFIIITHYQRLLQHIHPDQIHIMIDGRIVKSGDIQLAYQLEREGYKNF